VNTSCLCGEYLLGVATEEDDLEDFADVGVIDSLGVSSRGKYLVVVVGGEAKE